jgi:hypothetical protein
MKRDLLIQLVVSGCFVFIATVAFSLAFGTDASPWLRIPFFGVLGWTSSRWSDRMVGLVAVGVRALSMGTRRRVRRPPGHYLRRAAGLVFSPKTMTGVFEPWLADFRFEWQVDLANGRTVRIWLTRLRYTLTFMQHVVAQTGVSWVKPIVEAWKSFGS